MARKRTNFTLEEQLENIINDISSKEESIKEMKIEKKELEEQIRNKNITDLYDLIEKSGKSIDDIKKIITE